jgi:hypothetical protein
VNSVYQDHTLGVVSVCEGKFECLVKRQDVKFSKQPKIREPVELWVKSEILDFNLGSKNPGSLRSLRVRTTETSETCQRATFTIASLFTDGGGYT